MKQATASPRAPSKRPVPGASPSPRAGRTPSVFREDVARVAEEELLADKRAVFDAYARESSLADQAAAAVDVSEAELARQVVAAERARLGYGPVWDELMNEAREDDQPAT